MKFLSLTHPKKLSKLKDLQEYNFIHGKYLSDILKNHLFKFAILGGGISKFITISSGLPCIYIARNELEKIHLQNIRNLNLGYVVNSLEEITHGMRYIEENYELICKTSWDAIDGRGPNRFFEGFGAKAKLVCFPSTNFLFLLYLNNLDCLKSCIQKTNRLVCLFHYLQFLNNLSFYIHLWLDQ